MEYGPRVYYLIICPLRSLSFPSPYIAHQVSLLFSLLDFCFSEFVWDFLWEFFVRIFC